MHRVFVTNKMVHDIFVALTCNRRCTRNLRPDSGKVLMMMEPLVERLVQRLIDQTRLSQTHIFLDRITPATNWKSGAKNSTLFDGRTSPERYRCVPEFGQVIISSIHIFGQMCKRKILFVCPMYHIYTFCRFC